MEQLLGPQEPEDEKLRGQLRETGRGRKKRSSTKLTFDQNCFDFPPAFFCLSPAASPSHNHTSPSIESFRQRATISASASRSMSTRSDLEKDKKGGEGGAEGSRGAILSWESRCNCGRVWKLRWKEEEE